MANYANRRIQMSSSQARSKRVSAVKINQRSFDDIDIGTSLLSSFVVDDGYDHRRFTTEHAGK